MLHVFEFKLKRKTFPRYEKEEKITSQKVFRAVNTLMRLS